MTTETASRRLFDVEYKVDEARSHVDNVIDALREPGTYRQSREWQLMRLEQAQALLTEAVQLLWDEFGWGPLP